MSAIFRLWGTLREQEEISWKKCIPIAILTAYSFIGGGLFYLTERSAQDCSWDYWTSLYFAATLYTTIGYGNFACCTIVGKTMTCIYSLIGIPLMLVVVDTIGSLFAAVANSIWKELSCFCCCFFSRRKNLAFGKPSKNSIHARSTEEKKQGAYERSTSSLDGELDGSFLLPFWLGLVLTIGWMLLSALFFSQVERWYFLEATYFVYISVTTIGLGDFYPTDNKLTVLHMFFLVIGMALFSMCINLTQQKLMYLEEAITSYISKEYKNALENGGLSNNPSNLEDILKKKGGFMRYLMSKKAKKDLMKKYQDKASLRTSFTQTEKIMEDKSAQNSPSVNDFTQQVKDQEIQKVGMNEAWEANIEQRKALVHPKKWT